MTSEPSRTLDLLDRSATAKPHRGRRVFGWLLIALVPSVMIGAATGAESSAAVGKAYYVDCSAATSGDGSVTSPWNSFKPVNAATFTAGDKILLKRDSTCVGQSLFPKGSGAPGTPIVVDAYGTGAKPKLVGNGQVTDVVRLFNQQYWEIRNLDISNTGPTPGTRRGIYVTRANSGTGTYYRIVGNDVHDINGDVTKKDDNASAGIFFEVIGKSTPTKFDDVLIEGNTVNHVDRYGILTWTNWMSRPELNNSTCYGKWANWCAKWVPATNVVIRGNTVTGIGGDAITPHHTDGALVEWNRVDGFRLTDRAHCAAGVWGWNTNNAVYQFNEVSGGVTDCDAQAFDLDEGNIGTVIQYNYSHDNEGGFILLCNGDNSVTRDNIVRYNISQNDRGELFEFVCNRNSNTQIYNNTFYVSKPVQIIANANGSGASNATFTNNIFYVNTPQATYRSAELLPFSNNVFYGYHPAGEPPDPAKITDDPRLVGPGTATSITDANGYRLLAGSPAFNSGTPVPLPGSRDFFGQVLQPGQIPDRGAFQHSPTIADASVGADGTTWLTSDSDQIYTQTTESSGGQRWELRTRGLLRTVDVGNANNVIGINAERLIWRWNGSDWQRLRTNGLPAPVDVSIGSDGSAWYVGQDQSVWNFNPATSSWQQMPGGLVTIDVGSANNVVGIASGNTLWRWDGSVWTQLPAPVRNGTSLTPTSASTGADGALWITATDKSTWSWNGTTWTARPGDLDRLDVRSDNSVVGLIRNEIWTWDGSTWTRRPNP